MNNNPLSQNIAKYRKAAGLTQEELGKLLSVSMQAVSRWERGGAPDLSLLPNLAEVLGITIDELFNFTSKIPLDPATVLRRELYRTPESERLTRAYALALELLELTVDINDGSTDMIYQFLKLHEQIDRRPGSNAAPTPYLINYPTDQGFMRAAIAADFHYVLIMPEPDDGYAAVMKNEEEYIRLFTLLHKPHRLQALVYAQSRESRAFTAALLARDIGITTELAEEVLTELSRHRLMQSAKIDTPDGQLCTYTLPPCSSLVPFLYFGAELMGNNAPHTIFIPTRKSPLLRGQLGENGLFPNWVTHTEKDGNTTD